MLYFVPIEPLEERYTAQWYRWVTDALAERDGEWWAILGEPLATVTEGGQFLNWTSTTAYKAVQLQKIAKLFHEGKVKDGDVFFIADIWFPGIEAIAYMRDMLGLDVKIYGVQHAGPFDETDLTHKMLYWGKYQEAAWYACFDGVFVGSQHIKNKIVNGLRAAILPESLGDKLHVTGMLWNPVDVLLTASHYFPRDARPVIAWPHRLSPDKNVEQLYEIAAHFKHSEAQFLICSGRAGQEYKPLASNVYFEVLTKPAYYAMLRTASAMLSTAFHENYGYTVREATCLGTPVICPRRAVYPEMILSPENLYSNTQEAVSKIRAAIDNKLQPAKLREMGGLNMMFEIMGI